MQETYVVGEREQRSTRAIVVSAAKRFHDRFGSNNCRASSEVARPLYPQKLPRHSFAVAAVKGP